MANPEVIAARLRAMSAASASEPSPMAPGVDMSPAAVSARLHQLAQLWALCRRLAPR